jgi:hypothetical protein
MWLELANISILCTTFCLIDRGLSRYTAFDGIYYLIHSLHNAAIVVLTGEEVFRSITDFTYVQNSPKNILALQFVFALHLYHLIVYWKKFRYDDWLHHLLMIGIALPIGWITESNSLLGYSLFFTTGLPGGIDYFLLFLTRNYWMSRETEKKVNAYLNTWIRSPGCISHATLSVLLISAKTTSYSFEWFLGIIASILTFWNGQYFMRQVIENNILFSEWRKKSDVSSDII